MSLVTQKPTFFFPYAQSSRIAVQSALLKGKKAGDEFKCHYKSQHPGGEVSAGPGDEVVQDYVLHSKSSVGYSAYFRLYIKQLIAYYSSDRKLASWCPASSPVMSG
jgi:hypothetical protein